jgi:hypothetical protein
VKRDFRGRPLRCPNPRAYQDARMPDGIRFEPCRRNTCGACAAEKIARFISAIALVPVKQLGYATLLGDPDDLRASGAMLRRRTNAAFSRIESQMGRPIGRAMVVELSPTGRPHVHVLTREPAVRPAAFKAAFAREGLGRADLQTVRETKAAARYIFKTVMPPRGEEFVADELALREFLDMGGGRLLNTHGDFWIDVDGTLLDNAVQALRAARREWRRRQGSGGSPGTEESER